MFENVENVGKFVEIFCGGPHWKREYFCHTSDSIAIIDRASLHSFTNETSKQGRDMARNLTFAKFFHRACAQMDENKTVTKCWKEFNSMLEKQKVWHCFSEDPNC